MRVERQIELLDRLVGVDISKPWNMAPASMRNPSKNYTDPDRFAREMRVLFRNRPQFFGLSGECATPGAYLTADLGGVPIAVIRQPDGTLKAFVNACTHRASTLLFGRGETRTPRIVCPYHGWTFGTDGKLVNRPGDGGGFDDVKINCDLHERAIAEKYGLIFVQPTGKEPVDIDAALAGAESEIVDYDLAKYVHVESRTNTWKMNWKLFLDTFTESYHIRWLHKNTIAPYFMCDLLFDSFGPHPRSIGLRKNVVDQFKDKPRDEWRLLPYSTTQYFLVPNGLLVYQIDHVELWRITPIDVGTTTVTTSIFAPELPATEKARNYWKKNLDIVLQVTETEDFPTMEANQRNMASGGIPEVIYGRIEPALVHLHTSINAALAAADAATPAHR
jgi:nitrite reductase/ring-hydroxylating ferredoxin subunit